MSGRACFVPGAAIGSGSADDRALGLIVAVVSDHLARPHRLFEDMRGQLPRGVFAWRLGKAIQVREDVFAERFPNEALADCRFDDVAAGHALSIRHPERLLRLVLSTSRL